MKKMVKTLLFLVAVTVLFSMLAFSASAETTADGFIYTISNNEATITGYEGTSTDLIIPSTVDGYPVVAIGDSAFEDRSDFTGKLVIPEGVITIGSGAFSYCTGFTGELVIPEGVTFIGSYAFYSCSGFSGDLVIPEGITTIYEMTFFACIGLSKNIYLPESIKTIDTTAFYFSSLPSKLKHVAYYGTAEQWAMVDIKSSHSLVPENHLERATYFHANYNPETDISETVTSGNCIQEGYKTTACSCGYVYQKESIGFGEHRWSYDLDNTCESGMYPHICGWGCGAEKDIYIEGSGHNYQFVSDNNATCTEDGTMHEVCSRCYATGETVVDVGSKLGHDLTETTVLSQQSCTQDGISVQACKRCAEIVAVTESAYGHYDDDEDGKCDECSVFLEVNIPETPDEPETDDTTEEPEENTDILAKLMELLNKILNILKKLFGM